MKPVLLFPGLEREAKKLVEGCRAMCVPAPGVLIRDHNVVGFGVRQVGSNLGTTTTAVSLWACSVTTRHPSVLICKRIFVLFTSRDHVRLKRCLVTRGRQLNKLMSLFFLLGQRSGSQSPGTLAF